MLISVISPAKRLKSPEQARPYKYDLDQIAPTTPEFGEQSRVIMAKLKKQSASKIQKLMGISKSLAELNYTRNQEWEFPRVEHLQEGKAGLAALMFNGETYQGLAAGSLNKELVERAQERILILSGLHGLLKPLDVILPYRLEMGSPFKPTRAKTVREYWSKELTKSLCERLNEKHAKALINLSSVEYSSVFQIEKIPVPVIQPKFLNKTKVGYRPVSFLTKKARGAMARWILVNDINNAHDLSGFDRMNYKYDSKKSQAGTPTFIGD